MAETGSVEILYIAGSSRDRRGRLVLVRDDSGCENWIYAEDGMSEADKLLGLTEQDQRHIEKWFGKVTS